LVGRNSEQPDQMTSDVQKFTHVWGSTERQRNTEHRQFVLCFSFIWIHSFHFPSFLTLTFTFLLLLRVSGARCWWRSWLRHCATSQKVAGSITDGVTGIFHWHNPSSRTVALGLTQPLSEMSTRNISRG
jgi:hypothetical protein